MIKSSALTSLLKKVISNGIETVFISRISGEILCIEGKESNQTLSDIISSMWIEYYQIGEASLKDEKLNYLLIENEEIFKAAVDFWLWFSYKVFTLKDPEDTLDTFNEILDNNNNNMIKTKYSKSQYIQYLNESYLYKNCYMKLIDVVREIICVKMTKPLEVKIDIEKKRKNQ